MTWLCYSSVTFREDRLHVYIIHSMYPNIRCIKRLIIGLRCLWILLLLTGKRQQSPGHRIKTCVLVIFPTWLFLYSYKEQKWTNVKECESVFLWDRAGKRVTPLRQTHVKDIGRVREEPDSPGYFCCCLCKNKLVLLLYIFIFICW